VEVTRLARGLRDAGVPVTEWEELLLENVMFFWDGS
jgi:hypothetical protein